MNSRMLTAVAAATFVLTGSGVALSKPAQEHEPDDTARQAVGPLGPRGLELRRQTKRDDIDVFYVKARAGHSVRLTVTHIAGRCGDSSTVMYEPLRNHGQDGGQQDTAISDDAPAIDENGNQDAAIGDMPDTTQHATVTGENGRAAFQIGFVRYRDGYHGRDESTVGCGVRITARPTAALLTARTAHDQSTLKHSGLD